MPVEVWKSIFDWATVVLIAFTVVSGAGALITGDIINKRQDARLRTFDQDLTGAKIELGNQQERAARAELAASEAKKVAEDERLARLKLEAAVGWRSLGDEQKREIGSALTRFGNITGVSMWFVNGSPEAEQFADDIAEALRFAHIHTTTVGGVTIMREGGGNWDKPIEPANTGVDISSTTNPMARELAAALVKELTSRGFNTTLTAEQPTKDNKPPEPVVWVTVQARPKGPQGKYKLQAKN